MKLPKTQVSDKNQYSNIIYKDELDPVLSEHFCMFNILSREESHLSFYLFAFFLDKMRFIWIEEISTDSSRASDYSDLSSKHSLFPPIILNSEHQVPMEERTSVFFPPNYPVSPSKDLSYYLVDLLWVLWFQLNSRDELQDAGFSFQQIPLLDCSGP